MSQYRIGTATVANGDPNVFGVSVDWINNVVAGDWFIGPDKIKYEITTLGQLGPDQFIRLSVPYGGSTIASQPYVIHRDFLDGKPVFSDGDVETAAIINAWVATTGTVDQIQEVADALADQLIAMSQSEFEAVAEANRVKFAGSGFVEWGKLNAGWEAINEGMAAVPTIANQIRLGRSISGVGDSLTEYPIVNTDGVLLDLLQVNGDSDPVNNNIQLPPAPDGLDKKDGTGRFTDLAAAITAGGTSLNASIINRQDLLGAEIVWEDLETNDAVYPLGNVQYGASTYEGVALSNTAVAQGYSAFGEWDTATQGYGVQWSTLSDTDRAIFINRKENNIYRDAETGKLIQVRYRMRSIAGLGEEWEFANGGIRAFVQDNTFRLKAQGSSVVVPALETFSDATYKADYGNDLYPNSNDGATSSQKFYAASNDFADAHNGKCFFIPIALVSRRNQGARHPVLNPNGARRVWQDGVKVGSWYDDEFSGIFKTVSQLFTPADESVDGFGMRPVSGYIGTTSGREDDKFYDAIYEGDVKDLRKSARRKAKNDILVKAMNKAIAGEQRGFETPDDWEVVSVIAEAKGDSAGATSYSKQAVDVNIADFIVILNGDNVAYGYARLISGSSISLSKTRALALAGSSTGVAFSRTSGATTTIYRLKESMQFKERLQCDIIGDPANYYSGQTYTNTGVSNTVDIETNDTIYNNGTNPNGTLKHYYRRITGPLTADLSTVGLNNANNFADLGTTYDGQTWTSDGATQTVALETGDVIFVTDPSPVSGITNHYYRRVGTPIASADLSLLGYDSTQFADLGRKYRGQQFTNDGSVQSVDLVISDVVFNNGASAGGTEGNFYKRLTNISGQNLSGTDYSNTSVWTDLGSEWNESPAAGSWLQDGIAGFPLLTHADTGASLIPDSSIKSFKASRKVKDFALTLFSDDNGVTWGVSTAWAAGFESAANAHSASPASTLIYMHFYTSDAHATQEAANAVVDSLGSVVALSDHRVDKGNLLASSLFKKVLTDSASAGATYDGVNLTRFPTTPDFLVGDSRWYPEHNQISLQNPAGSPAVKMFSYISHENGLHYLMLLYKEVFWDTANDSITDFTDIDGSTVQTYTAGVNYRVTNVGLDYGIRCISTSNASFNSFTPIGDTFTDNAGTVVAVLWDGAGWGDDNQFNVVDNADVAVDLNGNNVLVGQARIELDTLTGLDN